jgi:predicted dehydrogenase
MVFGDVTVSYRGTWISPGPWTPWAGEWTMDFEGGQVTWTSRGDDIGIPDRVAIRKTRRQSRSVRLPEMKHVDRAGTLTEFVAALRESRQPETSGRDNLRTMAMVVAAVDSANRMEWVPVPALPD